MKLVWLAVLAVGCGKSDPASRPPPPPTRAAVPIDAAPAKPAPAPLPAAGMLCFEGTQGWVWSPDGSMAEFDRLPIAPIAAADGSLWNRDFGKGPHNPPDVLASLAQPPAPPLTLVHRFGETWRSASGSVLDLDDDDLQVWRGGAWTKLQAPERIAQVEVFGAVEYQGAWWIQTRTKILREDHGALVEVSLHPAKYQYLYPAGLVLHGDALDVLYANDATLDRPLMMARVAGGELQKPKKIGSLITSPSAPYVAINANGNWAAFARGGVFGTVYASIGGKITNPSRQALELLAIDGYDRIWYASEAGFVAVSPDGSEQVYPRATHPMFQLRDRARCLPIGKGFAQLPGTGAAQTGELVVEISGGANLPFAVCDTLLGRQRCENNPKKIAGTLDAAGQWRGQVPIGTYQATVQIDGAWLVADLSHGVGGDWRCEVKPGDSCTIKLSR